MTPLLNTWSGSELTSACYCATRHIRSVNVKGEAATHPCNKADDADRPAKSNRVHRLHDRTRSTDFKDVINTPAICL